MRVRAACEADPVEAHADRGELHQRGLGPAAGRDRDAHVRPRAQLLQQRRGAPDLANYRRPRVDVAAHELDEASFHRGTQLVERLFEAMLREDFVEDAAVRDVRRMAANVSSI